MWVCTYRNCKPRKRWDHGSWETGVCGSAQFLDPSKSANLGLGRSRKNWVSATDSRVLHWNDQRDSISEPTGILLVCSNNIRWCIHVYTIHMVKLCKIGAGGSCCNLQMSSSVYHRWRRQLPGDNCGWHENRASCRTAESRPWCWCEKKAPQFVEVVYMYIMCMNNGFNGLIF